MESEQSLSNIRDLESDVLNINDDSVFEEIGFDLERMCKNNFVFVDIQGFKTYGERFICKELCFVSEEDDDDFYHAIIKSPYPFEKVPSFYKRQAKWLIKFVHGLTYDCGDVHLIQVIQDTYAKLMNKIIIVKGTEKISWMKHIYRNCGEIQCLNFEDLDLDTNLEKLNSNMCQYHLTKMFSNLNLNEPTKRIRAWPEYLCAKTIAYKMKEAVKISDFTYNL